MRATVYTGMILPTNLFVMAACVIAFMAFTSRLSARRNRINARVEIADPVAETATAHPQTIPASLALPDGEVERTAAFHDWLRLWRHAPRSITRLCEQVDALYGIPRPASSPHLPPYQAATAFLGVCAEGVLIVLAGLFSAPNSL
ncbi:MAG: hypothetical protein ACREAM_28165 [Blastocatellia bacterium]